jgi:hypothetical protein
VIFTRIHPPSLEMGFAICRGDQVFTQSSSTNEIGSTKWG